MSIYALHRRTDLFRPDADRFRPESWATLRPIWDFVPFSGGPRHYPAQQLARSEIGYVLARLARGFQGWECRDPAGEFVEEVGLTFESFHGTKVGLIVA
jgi:cytochrome P450